MVFTLANTFQETNFSFFFTFGRSIRKFENNQIDFSYGNYRISNEDHIESLTVTTIVSWHNNVCYF